jgi:hypothetical protein
MRLERHGGNFQIHYPKLAALVFAPSRVRGSHGSVQGHEVLVGVIKKVGPSISKSIWPYELQFISAGSTILNRVYGVTTSQGQEIMEYATKVGLTIRKEQ